MAQVEPDVATIEADVAAVIADFHPVITNASAIMVEGTLGLCSSGSEDQTGCEHYRKFRFHNIHFYWFIESISNSYIGRRGGGIV
jgi:hypothetical protein